MKKGIFVSIIFIAAALSAEAAEFEKGVICLGNGEMCVYEDRADVFQLFGSPYSSPSVLELRLAGDVDVDSKREFGTAIWTHTLDNGNTGKLVDFVATENTAFVRNISNSGKLVFTLKLHKDAQMLDNTPNYRDKGVSKALMLKSPAGTYAYQDVFYPTLTANFYEFMVQGDAVMEQVDEKTWTIECSPGNSLILVTSGRGYPDFFDNTRNVLAAGYDNLLKQTRRTWNDFTSRSTDYSKILQAGVPQRERLLQAIDDVAVIIKTQQGTEGSVLAGYNYHLGYVRDQYGVSRGLIALGHVEDAEDVMDFYWNVWKTKGKIHNAQGIGLDAFHVHENDDVEITGYLIIQAFDLVRATGDNAYIEKIFPMLEWAWERQVLNLHRDMLPFNGDETYIAGGILPRTTMFDGSAEATMLFITSGKLLIDWAEKNNAWDGQTLARNKKILKNTLDNYHKNFWEDGKLATNNPDRKKGLELPEFRHGVCESCYSLEWTHRTSTDRYICAKCLVDKQLPAVEDKKYYLQSVSLLPWYIESDVLTDQEVEGLVRQAEEIYRTTGRLPARPDSDNNLGYDYGLFLFSLTRINSPLKDKLYDEMMSLIDPSGAWVEYYMNGIPYNTRCRPWESAINIEAAIRYAESIDY